ncbi:MAG: TylF/MycF/NovP-related O-methyltransferase [Bryobacteraceae bacterium]
MKRTARTIGYDIVKYHSEPVSPRAFPQDFTPHHISILTKVGPYTLTSPERIYSLIEAVTYVVRAKIPGSIVECGVWRGGSMMAAALTLRSMKCDDRDLYLFDTFEGMPKPLALDVHASGHAAMTEFLQEQSGTDCSAVCYASLNEVKSTMARTEYNRDRVHFIKGKVEETIPARAPDSIALLRLDTDWYESTRHELEHLFPRISPGGILIIDDYGDWQGARKATDEFMTNHAPTLLLSRIDDTGRLAVKI